MYLSRQSKIYAVTNERLLLFVAILCCHSLPANEFRPSFDLLRRGFKAEADECITPSCSKGILGKEESAGQNECRYKRGGLRAGAPTRELSLLLRLHSFRQADSPSQNSFGTSAAICGIRINIFLAGCFV